MKNDFSEFTILDKKFSKKINLKSLSTWCALSSLTFIDCEFEEDSITYQDIRVCDFIDCKFNNLVFYKFEINDCNFTNCEFLNCNFKRAEFFETNFVNCQFNKSNLQSTEFSTCGLMLRILKI